MKGLHTLCNFQSLRAVGGAVIVANGRVTGDTGAAGNALASTGDTIDPGDFWWTGTFNHAL